MAAKFRKIDPRIWTDEGFIRLDTEAKALTFWLLTARVNRCGIVQWSPALASEETGIPRDRVETVYPTVCDTLHWVRDEVSRTVFLARWWRYNAPDNPSAMQGFLDDLHDIPKNSLKPALIAASDDLKGKVREVYLAKLDTVYPTVSGTVLPQEKEKEKEKDSFFAVSASGPPREKKQPRKEAAPRKPNPLFDAIAEVAGADPSLPATASRIGKITADLAKASPPYTPDEVREFGRRFLELCSFARGARMRPELGDIQNHVGKLRAVAASTTTPATIKTAPLAVINPPSVEPAFHRKATAA